MWGMCERAFMDEPAPPRPVLGCVSESIAEFCTNCIPELHFSLTCARAAPCHGIRVS
jgi:hypothetical protein